MAVTFPNLRSGIAAIVRRDPRFHADAYLFLFGALEHTAQELRRVRDIPREQRMRITGEELVRGVRDYGHGEFGPLAKVVLESWGVSETRHIGDIVFNLVDSGLLRKDEKDKREDFDDVFDFQSALVDAYEFDFVE
jgi:uncharacterized repeat protein (TIGR04138 family)